MATVSDIASRFFPYIFAIFLREGLQREDAENQVQETFLRLLRFAGSGRTIPTNEEEQRALSRFMARRSLVDFVRRQKGRGKTERPQLICDQERVVDAVANGHLFKKQSPGSDSEKRYELLDLVERVAGSRVSLAPTLNSVRRIYVR